MQPNIYNTFQEICTRQVPYIQHTLLLLTLWLSVAVLVMMLPAGIIAIKASTDSQWVNTLIPEINACIHAAAHTADPLVLQKYNSTNKTQSWLCCSTVKCIMITTTSVHKKAMYKSNKAITLNMYMYNVSVVKRQIPSL